MCHVQRAEGAPRPGTGACRSLFGQVDHAELSREVHARLREMREDCSRRWDFDFKRGVPLPSSRYVWEERSEETVPSFYRTPRSTAEPERSPPETPERSPPETPDCTPPARTARPRAKRPPPAAQLTEFFSVRKKTKVVGALSDKLHPASPIPTEHTPRKMIR